MRLWNITLEKAVVVPKSEKDCETFMFQLFSHWRDWLHSCFWVCKSLQGIFQKPCCHSLRKLKLGRWSLFPTVCGSFIAQKPEWPTWTSWIVFQVWHQPNLGPRPSATLRGQPGAPGGQSGPGSSWFWTLSHSPAASRDQVLCWFTLMVTICSFLLR